MFIWQLEDWPRFTWDDKQIAAPLAAVRHEQGRLLGRMDALGFESKNDAVLKTLTQDVLMTSEIEGEKLDSDQIRSSIARHMGMDIAGLVPAYRNVEGIVEMMLDATGNHDQPLSEERLFDWHASLFQTGRSDKRKIRVGTWRDDATGPMQVVSGPIGRERVHYEAPPAEMLPGQMANFCSWFDNRTDMDQVLKAGLAHLWFITIHPFDDGNGRIARAVADMALARSEYSSQRFYSMSSRIRIERKVYYEILARTQKGALDVTGWLLWFFDCLNHAIHEAEETLGRVLFRARFWERFSHEPLNERQIIVLNRFMRDFEGNLTSSKWAKLAKCSQDTAGRDIDDLLKRGALVKNPGGGRSTSYSIAAPD
jgi:Fic family protein